MHLLNTIVEFSRGQRDSDEIIVGLRDYFLEAAQ
jgi:hypothetical protein